MIAKDTQKHVLATLPAVDCSESGSSFTRVSLADIGLLPVPITYEEQDVKF